MKFLNARVIYSLLFYVLAIVLLFVSKPSVLFAANGDMKGYGVGEGKTVFSFGVFAIALAILTFYTFALLDVIFQK